MRLPAHVLNGIAVALGISLIQITLTLASGKLAALAAATGAICSSLADLPIAPARTWRRVGMGAVMACVSGLLVNLLRESGVAMGITVMALSFCSTMALAWGLRAGPLSFIPILALIFTLAAPPPADLHALLIHSGWTAVGALLYFLWAMLSSRVLQPRYRTLALAAALYALAALLRSRAALLSRSEGNGPSPLQDWIRSQVALDERLQAARDLLFPAVGEPHTGPAIAVLLQAVEMRDTLLAGELDIELLGNDAPANQLRERLRVHGGRVAEAVEAMAQALRDHGMAVPASAAIVVRRDGHRDGRARAAASGASCVDGRVAGRLGGLPRRPHGAVGGGRRDARGRRCRGHRRSGGAGRRARAARGRPAGRSRGRRAQRGRGRARADARAGAAVRQHRPALSAGRRVLRPRAPDGGRARAHAGRAAGRAHAAAAGARRVAGLHLHRRLAAGGAARAADHALAHLPSRGAHEPGAGQRVLHRPRAALGLASALAGAERGAWCCAATWSRRCRAATTG